MAVSGPTPIPVEDSSPLRSEYTKKGLTIESITLSDLCPPSEIQQLSYNVSVDADVALWKFMNMVHAAVTDGDKARKDKDYERSVILYARALALATEHLPRHPEYTQFLQGMRNNPKYANKEYGNQWDKFISITSEKIKVLMPLVLARYEERKAEKKKREKAEAEAAREQAERYRSVLPDALADLNKRPVSEVIATPFLRISRSFQNLASRTRSQVDLSDPDWNKEQGGVDYGGFDYGVSGLNSQQAPSNSDINSPSSDTNSPTSEHPPHPPFAGTLSSSIPSSSTPTYPPEKRRKGDESPVRYAPALYKDLPTVPPVVDSNHVLAGGNETVDSPLDAGDNLAENEQNTDNTATSGPYELPPPYQLDSAAPTNRPSTPNAAPTERPTARRQETLAEILDISNYSHVDVDSKDLKHDFDDVELPMYEEIWQSGPDINIEVLYASPEPTSVALPPSRLASRTGSPVPSRPSTRPGTPGYSEKPSKLNGDILSIERTLSTSNLSDVSDSSDWRSVLTSLDEKSNPDTINRPCNCHNLDPDTLLTIDSDEESEPDDDDDDDDSISGEIVDVDDAQMQLSSSLELALEALNYIWVDHKSRENPPPLKFEEVFPPHIANKLRKINGFVRYLKE